MHFEKCTLISDNNVIELTEGEGGYIYKDVCIHIESDGKISITALETPIKAVVLETVNVFFDDAVILGDAWERAYGNLEWKHADCNRKMPWYFLAHKNGVTHAFGVKTQPNSFCSWQCDNKFIRLTINIQNGSHDIILNGRTINACTVVTERYQSDTFSAAQNFCGLMCDNPRFPQTPIFGGNDWYCNYGENSFDKILLHARRIAECAKNCRHMPYMVIDDGWQLCHHQSTDPYRYFNGGPWKYCNNNFGDMKRMAEAISDIGVIPGIWFRPLWTTEKIGNEYVLKSDGIKDTLDPSASSVIDIIKDDVSRLKNWGYKLIKHDFSTWDIFGKWGFEMDNDMYEGECNFSNRTQTTAEIIKNMYAAIREAAGDDVLIIGCNTVSHLAAGYFDIQRTGDDTSGLDWERTKKYGINTLAFRMPQHKMFYAVDADCVGITANIEWGKNRQWLDVLAQSGTPLFVSIAENAFSKKIKEEISMAFKKSEQSKNVSHAIDWMENVCPTLWESTFGIDKYVWD